MNEYQIKAEAAVMKAKAILTENKVTVIEMDRVMTDGNNEYTRNVSGSFSAQTEAQFYLTEAVNSMVLPFGASTEDCANFIAALDWMEVEAAKLGFEI